MVSQEEIFIFFQKMSVSLEKDGYKIIDNLKYDFPSISYEEEILNDKILEKQKNEELENNYDHLPDE